jgi:HSP20 family protein
MPVERWHPFRFERVEPIRDLAHMQNQMNRVFDDFFGTRAQPTLVDRVWAPAIDIYETREELVVVAEVPGVKEKDIQLSIVENVLSLKGQRLPAGDVKEESYHRIERWTGGFERYIQLPVPVQADKVRASYRDGVLEVRLPKIEAVKPREIKIEVS